MKFRITYPPAVGIDPRTCPTCGSAVWRSPEGAPPPAPVGYGCAEYLCDALDHFPPLQAGYEGRAAHAALHAIILAGRQAGTIDLDENQRATILAALKSLRIALHLGRLMAPFDSAVLKSSEIPDQTPIQEPK